MNILVCIKQVPGSGNVEVDPVTGTLKRSGVKSKMNPFDLYALEAALSLCEKEGGTVETLTMGPPQAKEIIIESVCMGAKRGFVLSDRAFAGADVLATAHTLSQGVKKCGTYDLIFCGKQTTDGDTAQVGAEMAEFLELPGVANVLSFDEVKSGSVTLKASLDGEVVRMTVKTPCVISMDRDVNMPRLPSYRVKKGITDDAVTFFSLQEMNDTDANHYGLLGSATQVERIFPPEHDKERRVVEGSAAEQTEAIFDLIRRKKLI